MGQFHLKKNLRPVDQDLAQWVQVLATKPDLSSIIQTHMVEGEKQLLSCPLTTLKIWCTPTYMHVHT